MSDVMREKTERTGQRGGGGLEGGRGDGRGGKGGIGGRNNSRSEISARLPDKQSAYRTYQADRNIIIAEK